MLLLRNHGSHGFVRACSGCAAATSLLMNARRLHRTLAVGAARDMATLTRKLAKFVYPVLATRPAPTAASWAASEGGYSAVNVLRYTPFSRTPAVLACLCRTIL